jgi:hypothetical protein
VQYGDNPNNSGVIQGSGPRDPDKFDVFQHVSDGQTTVAASAELYTP